MNKWYNELNKAPWTPPGYVFGIVWSILYTLMIISFLMVFLDKKCYPYCSPLTYFLIQLGLNLIWTTVFFKLRLIVPALILLFLILLFTCYTYKTFRPINKIASYLLIPYILWLCVAISLNIYIVTNNKIL
jgi:translocator protein